MKARKGEEFPATIAALERMGALQPGESLTWIPDFEKPAGERCQHQKHGKGCKVYALRPFGCRTWSCQWLTNDDTAALSRPDRAHYCIDPVPDYVTGRDDATGKVTTIPVIQIWCDEDYPDAHRDPALRAYLFRRGKREGMAALIRFAGAGALFICPPALSATGQWHEVAVLQDENEHTPEQRVKALGPMRVTLEITP
jgi:hypothetical protein